MNIAILGFGSQGQSAYGYWNTPDNHTTICDTNTDLDVPEGAIAQLGADYLHDLDRFDLIVRSPSIHPEEIRKLNPVLDYEKKVTSNTNEFFHVCPTKNIIGVTGTKGKGTTSTLIARMLEATGHTVHLGGNIGTPPLEMLKDNIRANDWVVLELANFQLIDLRYSPKIAVCLMVVSEHLDWHKDVEEYYTAKQQLFIHQQTNDICVYFAQNPHTTNIVSTSAAKKVPYFQAPGAHINDAHQIVIDDCVICDTSEAALLGAHNLQNICAAVTAAWNVTQNSDAIKSVITNFSGMEYRLEKIREVQGVSFYNDSFGTTPETAIVAIEAIPQPKVIILGGSSKGADFTELAKTIRSSDSIRKAILIGDEAPRIAKHLEEAGFNNYLIHNALSNEDPMRSIVLEAMQYCEPGNVVLLSTACASFDMFKNYKDRGDQFNRVVRSLDSVE